MTIEKETTIALGNEYSKRTSCRFCESEKLSKVLDFGRVPLAGAFLKKEDFQTEKLYPLEIYFCEVCSLVQVCDIISADTLFKNYFYFSSSIGTLVTHCKEWALESHNRFLKDEDNPFVVEIGCNDGVMLRPFANLGVRALGVDPATNVVNSVEKNGFDIINDCFTEEVAGNILDSHGQADLILSSYSFAHIDDMISVIKGVRNLLKDNGTFIFEVYYVGTLIDEMQYDMIYHEHFSYYSLHALQHFLNQYDMEIFDTKFTPGVRSGAVRFYAKKIGMCPDKKPTESFKALQEEEVKKGYHLKETYLRYADKVEETKVELLKILDQLKGKGKTIVGYGASGRGTMIMNYCGISTNYLDYVVDDAPAKHGYYTPGTHVEIKPGSAIDEDNPDYALLFAWSFANEVVKRRSDFVNKGGKFIVPLPEVKIIPEN